MGENINLTAGRCRLSPRTITTTAFPPVVLNFPSPRSIWSPNCPPSFAVHPSGSSLSLLHLLPPPLFSSIYPSLYFPWTRVDCHFPTRVFACEHLVERSTLSHSSFYYFYYSYRTSYRTSHHGRQILGSNSVSRLVFRKTVGYVHQDLR